MFLLSFKLFIKNKINFKFKIYEKLTLNCLFDIKKYIKLIFSKNNKKGEKYD